MNCPACQFSNRDGSRFCSQCGAVLPAPPPPPAATAAAATPVKEGLIGGAPFRVIGYETQAAVVQISYNQAVMAEPGALLYMRGDVDMDTSMSGGFFSGLKRAIAGDSFFLTKFGSNSQGEVCFAAPYPGTIHPLQIGEREWLCQRHSFLCCSPGVNISVGFTRRLGYGLFSGEGFILQRLAGNGDALVHAGGHFIQMQLTPGETIRIDTGSVVAFDANISYDIEFVKGFKNLLFGGEGLFFITLTGPGTVILQTLSFDRLVSRIAAVASRENDGGGGPGIGGVGTAAGLGALGGILGGILGGDQNSGNF